MRMKTIMQNHWTFLFTVLSCLVLAACSAEKPGSVDREALLQERVTIWNQARIEQNISAAYELIWSGYKEVVPLGDYPNRRSGLGRINEYQVEGIEIADDEAVVELRTNFDAFGYTLEGRRERQVWVWENGNWHIKIEPVISTPFGTIPIKRDE